MSATNLLELAPDEIVTLVEGLGQPAYRGRQLATWVADDVLPSRDPNGHTSTRRVIRNVELKPGDAVTIEAAPDEDEFAVVDYVEIVPRR